MAYAVGHISGGHFNPAVTIGLWAGGRFKAADVLPYIIAQVIGAIVAARCALPDCLGQARLDCGRFRLERLWRPQPWEIWARRLLHHRNRRDVLFPVRDHRVDLKGSRCRFCRDSDRSGPDIDPLDHDPGHHTSVNPARSIGPALFAGGPYIAQLWLFCLAPIIGAALAGFFTRWLYQDELVAVQTVVVEERQVA